MSEKTRAQRRRSRAPQVHAGVHEPAGQDRDLPAARHRAAEEDSGHRIESGSAAHLQHLGRPRVRVHGFRRQQGLPAGTRHGSEVRRTSPEARHRASAGAADVEPDRDRPGSRRRLDSRRLRSRHRTVCASPAKPKACRCRKWPAWWILRSPCRKWQPPTAQPPPNRCASKPHAAPREVKSKQTDRLRNRPRGLLDFRGS